MAGYGFLPAGVMRSWSKLSRPAQAVAGALASFMSSRGSCWPGREKLGARAGVTRDNTLRAALQELEGQGLVARKRRRRASTIYTWQESAPAAESSAQESAENADSKSLDSAPSAVLDSALSAPPIMKKPNRRNPEVLEKKDEETQEQIIADIYGRYPRKVARKAAIKAIRAAAKEQSLDYLLDRVSAYAAAVARWSQEDRQYIPHPATWFHQARYDDDPGEWAREDPRAADDDDEPVLLSDMPWVPPQMKSVADVEAVAK